MKFGIFASLHGENLSPPELGRAVEERGFDSLFTGDHSHIPARGQPPIPPPSMRIDPDSLVDLPGDIHASAFAPLVALAAIATATEKILLGTAVTLLIQRDPIHTAKEVATLDQISGGRTVFGVGVGWNRAKMRNHGTDPATRGALLDEQIQALREIWTNTQAEFHGKYVNFDPITVRPQPVQRPLPIYVGGESPPAQRRAAALGDGWLPGGLDTPPSKLADVIADVREKAGWELPVTLSGVRPGVHPPFEQYAKAGVERVLLASTTHSRDETLTELDEFAAQADAYRNAGR